MCDRCAERKGEAVPTGVCEEKMALGICPHIAMPEPTYRPTEVKVRKAVPIASDRTFRMDGGVLLTPDGIPLMGD